MAVVKQYQVDLHGPETKTFHLGGGRTLSIKHGAILDETHEIVKKFSSYVRHIGERLEETLIEEIKEIKEEFHADPILDDKDLEDDQKQEDKPDDIEDKKEDPIFDPEDDQKDIDPANKPEDESSDDKKVEDEKKPRGKPGPKPKA